METLQTNGARHENVADVVFVPSPVKISLFRLAYFVLSSLRTRRNNKNHTSFRYFAFAFRGEVTKIRSSRNQPSYLFHKTPNYFIHINLISFNKCLSALFRLFALLINSTLIIIIIITRNVVIYGPTDRPKCAKQYTASSSKGHNNNDDDDDDDNDNYM